ncbi:Uncharacterised protein [Mycobacteroides abscessus subsp. abscessus]|uniref:DUF4352 domain-containing protein n=4 Tax=Mycobacteroides abscessus TaxID=36809 RepID=B1MB06_MYCA9|nr:hypothetical protein [Mycobacteroides abscessus]AKP58219.1 hypothetical protein MAUC22_11670 [Mycobacteroides abscessus UC22]ALM16641.1 hypothetical protein AOY11_10620 [Mycobacteroides abscessus]AMU45840.1 hypothetical protein A3O00_11785 [Mycobacteroides abscessus]AMU50725.1 hypothetical protein A3O01_11660 [Mycobacteroides abscessus]AMU55705.1 hypothetical protein A3O02_11415 [Mycobacteroides abscessus]
MTENYEIPGPKHRRSRARNLLSQLWFRNVVAAVVAAVTIAAIGFLSFRAPWETYRASVTPAHTVPAGQSQVIDGQTWELGAIRHLGKWPRSFASAIPKGTEISVVTIKRSGPAPAVYCRARITDGTHAWLAESYSGIPFPDGTSDMCSKPGSLQFAFVLPEQTQATAVEIMDGDRISVRLNIPD